MLCRILIPLGDRLSTTMFLGYITVVCVPVINLLYNCHPIFVCIPTIFRPKNQEKKEEEALSIS